MDNGFAEVIRRMVSEQGKEVLVNGRAKIYLADYCAGQFKKEMKTFRQILDAGCGEHINNADNVQERKLKLMEQLEEDYDLSPKATAEHLDLLGLILKGDTSKCGEAAPPAAPKPVSSPAQTKPSVPAPSAVPDGFVWIEGGTFMMGSPKDELFRGYNEDPQHQVTVSGFYMGKYQVTQKEYKAVMRQNPSRFKYDNHPVENISWEEAIEYCNKRSLKERLTPAYTGNRDKISWDRNANGYRLPTEAEWEYACRAGTTTAYNTGAKISDYTGWCDENSGDWSHPVGQKPANAWGLYDMHGNILEFCWDLYEGYSSEAQIDPVGTAFGDKRVVRGGSWTHSGQYMRSACRCFYYSQRSKNTYVGFRLVRS
jgi:formylglycine-generating enzyme required for sulfatase activity